MNKAQKMSSILIHPKNENEAQFIQELLAKLKVKSQVLTEEEKEDLGLAFMIKEANLEEQVSQEEIAKKLKS